MGRTIQYYLYYLFCENMALLEDNANACLAGEGTLYSLIQISPDLESEGQKSVFNMQLQVQSNFPVLMKKPSFCTSGRVHTKSYAPDGPIFIASLQHFEKQSHPNFSAGWDPSFGGAGSVSSQFSGLMCLRHVHPGSFGLLNLQPSEILWYFPLVFASNSLWRYSLQIP